MPLDIKTTFTKAIVRDYLKILWLGPGFTATYEDAIETARGLQMIGLAALERLDYFTLINNIDELRAAHNLEG